MGWGGGVWGIWLQRWACDKTLIVASSDLSHYRAYEAAKELDTRCLGAICGLDIERMKGQGACGKLPILALMHLAKKKGWKARLLDYRNSGDTAGDKRRVVGDGAVAFYESDSPAYAPPERRALLELARESLAAAAAGLAIPEMDPKTLAGQLSQPKGCFVTLMKAGALRGCIGHIFAREPLYQAVLDNARSAALNDPRFAPVKPDEVAQIEIELSVLTEPRRLEFGSADELLGKLEPHRDGVVLQIGARTATYLPQVWEQIPEKAAFLNHLAEKAGCDAAAWRLPGATVSVYRAEHFSESEK